MFAYILYNHSTRMVQLSYSPSTLCSHEAYCKHTYIIKSHRKLNKFKPLPQIIWCFKSQLFTMYLLLLWRPWFVTIWVASPPQDLSVAYSREGQIPDWTFSIKASLYQPFSDVDEEVWGPWRFCVCFLDRQGSGQYLNSFSVFKSCCELNNVNQNCLRVLFFFF